MFDEQIVWRRLRIRLKNNKKMSMRTAFFRIRTYSRPLCSSKNLNIIFLNVRKAFKSAQEQRRNNDMHGCDYVCKER